MAKSLKFRSFTEGGEEVRFSSILFREKINEYIKKESESTGKKVIKEAIYHEIAEAVHVSDEAVKKWAQGHNGPGDFQTVKAIAIKLGIDYKELLVPTNENNPKLLQDFIPAGSDERELILQIYKLFSDYIYWFVGSAGDNYAARVLENPEDERMEYIWNLYHFLDRIALSISSDTYSKLKKLITQIDVISRSYHDSVMILPDLWMKLNPHLKSVTDNLFDVYSGDAQEVIYSHESIYKNNNSPSIFDPCVKEIFHIVEEDLEDYSEALDRWSCISCKVEEDYSEKYIDQLREWGFISLNKDDNENGNSGKIYINTKMPYIYTLLWSVNGDNRCFTYQIVCREISATLIMVMKHLFPQYFGEASIVAEKKEKA